MATFLKVILIILIVLVCLFLLTFLVYMFNLDMKLMAALYPKFEKMHDKKKKKDREI